MRYLRAVVGAALGVTFVASACKSSPTQPTEVTNLVTGVQTSGGSSVQATQQAGQPPAPSGGPAATVAGSQSAVSGGGSSFEVSAATPFRKVLISTSSGNTPIDGFFELVLPADTTIQGLVVNYSTAIPVQSFSVKVQVVTAAGQVGPVQSRSSRSRSPAAARRRT